MSVHLLVQLAMSKKWLLCEFCAKIDFFCMNGFFRVLVLEKTWVANFHSSFVVSVGRENLDSCRKPCTCKISPLMQKYSNRNIIKQLKHIFIIYLNIATLF